MHARHESWKGAVRIKSKASGVRGKWTSERARERERNGILCVWKQKVEPFEGTKGISKRGRMLGRAVRIWLEQSTAMYVYWNVTMKTISSHPNNTMKWIVTASVSVTSLRHSGEGDGFQGSDGRCCDWPLWCLCSMEKPWEPCKSVSVLPERRLFANRSQRCFSSLLLISVPARRFPRQLSLAAPPVQICYANLCLALKE